MNNFFLTIQSFSLIFTSIVLEALPFILLGSLVSAFVQMFLTEDMIKKIIPKNIILSSLSAVFLGIFFPICECATVPITRGLLKKGVPLRIAVTYMLSAPIVNPMVLLSTLYAFEDNTKILILRVALGILIAIITGILIEVLQGKKSALKEEDYNFGGCACCSNSFNQEGKFKMLLSHGTKEFFEVGKFFLIGATLAALFQTFIPKSIVGQLSSNGTVGIIIMMALAYILSLCSEADAFIGKSFMSAFSEQSILAFLLFGPMIDLKNTIMLLGGYKQSFIVKLLFLVTSLCFIFCSLIIF